MDWHFRVHQRMAEAEKRGQHRSWYLDELDWIKSREVDEDLNTAALDSNGLGGASSATTAKPEVQSMPVPAHEDNVKNICPICQEEFDLKWLDDKQEFHWMDAQMINGRAYHSSCYAEASKDSTTAVIKESSTVLGKRKAEVNISSRLYHP